MKDGGPAFPRPASEFTRNGTLPDGNDAVDAQCGMTMRQYYAGRALATLIGGTAAQDICNRDPRYNGTNFAEAVAINALEFADAMLAANDGRASDAAKVNALRNALAAVASWRGIHDESDLVTWERIADRFYADTGYLRPGKDQAPQSGVTLKQRQEAWNAWVDGENELLDQQIRAALAFDGKAAP